MQHRPADRPRRAVVLTPRAARRAGVDLHLALKSGNFGADDFFTKAFDAGMTESQAREEICRDRAQPVRARLRARHGRQHQRATD